MRPDFVLYENRVETLIPSELDNLRETFFSFISTTISHVYILPDNCYSRYFNGTPFQLEDFLAEQKSIKKIFVCPISKTEYYLFSKHAFTNAEQTKKLTVLNKLKDIMVSFKVPGNALAYGYKSVNRVDNAFIKNWTSNLDDKSKIAALKSLVAKSYVRLTANGKKFCEKKIERAPMQDASKWDKKGVLFDEKKDAQKGLRDLSPR